MRIACGITAVIMETHNLIGLDIFNTVWHFEGIYQGVSLPETKDGINKKPNQLLIN